MKGQMTIISQNKPIVILTDATLPELHEIAKEIHEEHKYCATHACDSHEEKENH